MAQTGYTPIQLYYSATASAAPLAANLAAGELAINTNDGKLYYKDSAGAVQTIASKAGSVNVSSFSAGTTGFTPSTATTGAVTLAGTLATTNGGTGLTSFTANGVVYASSTSALATGSALTFDGTQLGVNVAAPYGGAYATIHAFSAGGANFRLDRTGSGTSTIQSVQTGVAYRDLTLDAANNIFSISGSEQMRLTSTGLGIGTSSPAQKLDVGGGTGTPAIRINGGSSTNTGPYLQFARGGTQTNIIGPYSSVASGTANDLTYYSASGYGHIWFSNGQASNINMQLDSAGNLGLGVTPSASNASTSLEMANGSTLFARTAAPQFGLMVNAVGNWYEAKYKTSAAANMYLLAGGQHQWYNAPSGTAGNAISFTQVMTLGSSGNLGIGTSSPTAKLEITGGLDGTFNSNILINSTSTTAKIAFNPNGISSGIGGLNDGTVVFYGNGANTERARIDSSGNLLVGTTSSPNSGEVKQLIANSSGGAAYLQFQNVTTATGCTIGTSGENFIVYTNTNTIGGGGGSYSERARIDSSGNLGIGVTNPSSYIAGGSYLALALNGTNGSNISLNGGGGQIGLVYAATGNSNLYVTNQTASGNLIFGVGSGTERARIDSSGNLLVGTTTNVVAGAGHFSRFNADLTYQFGVGVSTTQTTGAAYFVNFVYNGSLIGSISTTAGSVTLYNTTSDYRLKTVIGAVSGSGERIDALKPVEYTWNADGSRTRGFLAHQFQEVYAGSVSGTKDAVDAEGKPVYQAMQASSSEVIADLVAEIQSLRKRLADAGIA